MASTNSPLTSFWPFSARRQERCSSFINTRLVYSSGIMVLRWVDLVHMAFMPYNVASAGPQPGSALNLTLHTDNVSLTCTSPHLIRGCIGPLGTTTIAKDIALAVHRSDDNVIMTTLSTTQLELI